MFRLLIGLGIFLTNVNSIQTYNSSTASPSYSPSASPSASAYASTSPSSYPSASSIPPTYTPPRSNNSINFMALVVVGSTIGAFIIIGTLAGIHVALKRRYENTRLVTTVNQHNNIHQTSIRTLLPSRRILYYKDESDNQVTFPPVNNV
jgi:hypothetical protein